MAKLDYASRYCSSLPTTVSKARARCEPPEISIDCQVTLRASSTGNIARPANPLSCSVGFRQHVAMVNQQSRRA